MADFNAILQADESDLTTTPGILGSGGSTTTYWMRGKGAAALRNWSVTGSADFAGASAPEAVTDVVLLDETVA